MPDSKITALTSIGASTDPANDPLVLVDVSDTSMAASGTTKKVTLNQLLGASGTATLASATITGDLTVRTTGLTVNSSGVGVGLTAALGAGNIQIAAGKYLGYSASAYITPEDNVQGARIKADNILIDGNTSTKWNIGGSTAMTLNSTGLGVGVTPANDKVLVSQTIGLITSTTADLSFRNIAGTAIQRIRFSDASGTLTVGSATATAYPVELGGDTVSRAVIIDGSKNVGVGGNASVTGIGTGVARLFVVAPNSNTGMAATFIADSVGRGLLVADQGKTNSFGVEVVAGLVKTGGFTSGTSVALFANAVERARVKSTGQVRFVPLAADPSGAEAGDVYYNSSSNKLKCYNGSTWNDLF